MKTNDAGRWIIQAFESCLKKLPDGRYTTYRCPANVVTIGWGTTASDVPSLKEGEVWTKTRCDDVFSASLGKYEAFVSKAAAGVDLNPNQFSALVSLTYNCGPGALNGSIGAALRERRLTDIPALMKRWNKAGGRVLKGLVRRREAEALLFACDVTAAFQVAGIAAAKREPMPQKVDAKPGASDVAAAGTPHLITGAGLLAAAMAAWDALPIEGQVSLAVIVTVGLVWLAMLLVEKARKLKETWS